MTIKTLKAAVKAARAKWATVRNEVPMNFERTQAARQELVRCIEVLEAEQVSRATDLDGFPIKVRA